MPPHPKKPAKPKSPRPMRSKPPKIVTQTTVTAQKVAAPKPNAPEGKTKTEMLTEMLSTAGGATSKEMEAAAGWQPHSVRGFLGTLRKKGVNVVSKKLPNEPTIYRIQAGAPAPAAETVGDVV